MVLNSAQSSYRMPISCSIIVVGIFGDGDYHSMLGGRNWVTYHSQNLYDRTQGCTNLLLSLSLN